MNEIYFQYIAFCTDMGIHQVFHGGSVLGFYKGIIGVDTLGFVQENQGIGIGRRQVGLVVLCFGTGSQEESGQEKEGAFYGHIDF